MQLQCNIYVCGWTSSALVVPVGALAVRGTDVWRRHERQVFLPDYPLCRQPMVSCMAFCEISKVYSSESIDVLLQS